MTNIILNLVSFFILISSVIVVTATSPVVSVLYLVSVFLLASSYIIIMGISFVGLIYLVVYVGAVAVLFLFVIIILNVPLTLYNQNRQPILPLVTILTSLFIGGFVIILNSNPIGLINFSYKSNKFTTSFNQAQVLATEIFTYNSLILIIIGLILLIAIIGPVTLCMDHDNNNNNI